MKHKLQQRKKSQVSNPENESTKNPQIESELSIQVT